MRRVRLFGLIGSTLLLAGCEAEVGTKQESAPSQAAEAPAAGKSEEGRLSLKGPGFDFKINIPEGMATEAGDADNGLLYPGAKLSGMHIEAGQAKGSAGAASGVELRFTSADAIEKVAAWYRDPGRKETFTIASAEREGDALVLSGREAGDGEPFTLRLSPSGAGTAGRLTLTDKS